MNYFDTFGVMVDCSRNAVMSVESLKKFMVILKKMGYNQVQLYMEDTYEVESEPLFGHFRGNILQMSFVNLTITLTVWALNLYLVSKP